MNLLWAKFLLLLKPKGQRAQDESCFLSFFLFFKAKAEMREAGQLTRDSEGWEESFTTESKYYIRLRDERALNFVKKVHTGVHGGRLKGINGGEWERDIHYYWPRVEVV